MSRDNWARLVEAVVRREQIWQMFHDHSRSPSISTIASEEDDPTNRFSGTLTIDSFKALSVSPSVSVRNPVVSQPVSSNANSTGPFSRKLFSSWYRRRKPKDHSLVDIPEFDLGLDVRRFSKSEIQAASDYFREKNCLIQPGFQEVRKGRLSDGSVVAIKRFKQGTHQDADLQLFQTEVEVVGKVVHPNIIHLLGYCITPYERMLIYPFMVHGSVASCLRERPLSQARRLNWSIRKRIALGSAKGLAYLHDKCDPKIIHGDVKAANILLDEDFNAVVADFELAILTHHSHVTTAVRGTIGHMAPEYISGGICTEKIDVFGYGVFLLELITGQRAFDLIWLANDDNLKLFDWVKRNLLEKTWRRLVDPECEAGGDLMEEEVEQVIQLSLICTQTNPLGRPKMSEIVRMLEDGSGLVERWIQWQQEEEEERLRNELITSPNMYWEIEDDIPPDELISGPR